MINSVFLRFVSILFLWCITFTDAKKESLNRVSLASPFTGRSRCSRSPRKDGSCRPSGSTRKTRNRRSSRTPGISGQFSLSVIFGFFQTATKQIHCVCDTCCLMCCCSLTKCVNNCVSGWTRITRSCWRERTAWTFGKNKHKVCTWCSVTLHFAPAAFFNPPSFLFSSVLLLSSSSFLLSSFSSSSPLLLFSSCRDRLVCPACVETPEPRERRVTKVLSVSSDLRESRERRETEAFLGLRDPLDPKESP